MRVLTISHLYPSPGTDRHLFVHDQCLALHQLGVDFHVISPTPYTPRILWGIPRLRRRGQRPRLAIRDGIVAEYPRFLQPPRRILLSRLGDFAYCGARRLPSLATNSFDLIHAHQALPNGALAQRLSHDLGVPYLVTVHGADVNSTLQHCNEAARKTIDVLRNAAAVVTVSTVLAERLLQYAPLHNVTAVENGGPGEARPVAPTTFAPGRQLVLAAGRLEPGKGFNEVLSAVAALPAAFSDVEVAIVGDGSLHHDLVKQAASLGLAERVHFLDNLEHDELFALMARADVFALPSAPEGFGLVHLEAMAQGTPTIACSGEGPSTFIEDGISGRLVASGDATALREALAQLLANPTLAQEIGAAGQRVARTFTWERNARRMLELYEATVADRHEPSRTADG